MLNSFPSADSSGYLGRFRVTGVHKNGEGNGAVEKMVYRGFFCLPGVIGIIMASFLGYLLGKSMLETKGFFGHFYSTF